MKERKLYRKFIWTAILLLAGSGLLLSTFSYAQKTIVTATLDTNAIMIGQQAKLTLAIRYKTDQGDLKIEFPKVADTIIKQIEVVERTKVEKFIPDSSDMSVLAQSQTFILTSFDSGYYAIPPFKFTVNGDSSQTFETEPVLFTVNTVQVDTTMAIKDIKPPIEVPFSWKELLPYLYGGLTGVAVLAGLIFLIIYILKKQKKPVPAPIVIPKTPAHVTALEHLNKLREEKLWQNGKLKEYHSALTDILRQYIEHRFYINAMEQVTDEIMYSFRTLSLPEEQKMKLRQVLVLADLVKFAKEQPLPNENEGSWQHAYDFILATKKEDPKPVEDKTQQTETKIQ